MKDLFEGWWPKAAPAVAKAVDMSNGTMDKIRAVADQACTLAEALADARNTHLFAVRTNAPTWTIAASQGQILVERQKCEMFLLRHWRD